MKESSKFLIVIVIIAIFTVGIIAVLDTAVTQITQDMAPASADTEMKTETFKSTTISVPANANFTEESGVYVDVRNQIVIEIVDQTIPESQSPSYAEVFADQGNITRINSTDLANNTMAFKGPSGETIIFVVGENQTAMIGAMNQELAFKMAKSVEFSG